VDRLAGTAEVGGRHRRRRTVCRQRRGRPGARRRRRRHRLEQLPRSRRQREQNGRVIVSFGSYVDLAPTSSPRRAAVRGPSTGSPFPGRGHLSQRAGVGRPAAPGGVARADASTCGLGLGWAAEEVATPPGRRGSRRDRRFTITVGAGGISSNGRAGPVRGGLVVVRRLGDSRQVGGGKHSRRRAAVLGGRQWRKSARPSTAVPAAQGPNSGNYTAGVRAARAAAKRAGAGWHRRHLHRQQQRHQRQATARLPGGGRRRVLLGRVLLKGGSGRRWPG